MAVNCAILSYNGAVYFGFSGDAHVAPDLRKLEKLLLESFEELRTAVGIRSAEQKRARRKTTRVVHPISALSPNLSMPIPVAVAVRPIEPKRVAKPLPTVAQENSLPNLVVA